MGKKALIQLQTNIDITKCTSHTTAESRHKGLFRWLLKIIVIACLHGFWKACLKLYLEFSQKWSPQYHSLWKSTKYLCNRLSLFRNATHL